MEPRVYHDAPRTGSSARSLYGPAAASMSPQHTPASRQRASVPPSVRNVFDREPLLIPQRSADRPRPWYRRRSVLASILVLVSVVAAAAWLRASWSGALRALVGR